MLILTLPHVVLFHYLSPLCCTFALVIYLQFWFSGFCSVLSLPYSSCSSSCVWLSVCLRPGDFCLLVWVPLVSVFTILGYVCSWTLTTFWMVPVTPPARSSQLLGWVNPHPLPPILFLLVSVQFTWHAPPSTPLLLTKTLICCCDERFLLRCGAGFVLI